MCDTFQIKSLVQLLFHSRIEVLPIRSCFRVWRWGNLMKASGFHHGIVTLPLSAPQEKRVHERPYCLALAATLLWKFFAFLTESNNMNRVKEGRACAWAAA